jgi:hypothetical protein
MEEIQKPHLKPTNFINIYSRNFQALQFLKTCKHFLLWIMPGYIPEIRAKSHGSS